MFNVIDGLTLMDLKISFKQYCRTNLIPEQQLKDEWDKFWKILELKCHLKKEEN